MVENYDINKVQTLANNFLSETDIEEIYVTSKEGHKIMVIHLLTDFYKYLKQH
jgi:hypothetical protein